MNKPAIMLLVPILMILSGCDKQDDNPQNLIPKSLELTAGAPQTIASGNEFGIELFTRVSSEEPGNLMLSPLSASTALTMLLNGCSDDTYDQLKEALKYPSELTISEINEAYGSLVSQLLEADPKVTFSLANAVFYRNEFSVKQSYLNIMDVDYDAYIRGLDFSLASALTAINKWAADNTNGKIPKVLDEISAQAVMFIMNALYFKGDWSYQFDKTKTADKPFYPEGISQINVRTMNSEVGAKVVTGSGFNALEMPYGRTNFTMVVIVPDQTLTAFLPTFNFQMWNNLTGELDELEEFGKTIVYMPKFTFDYGTLLNQQLQAMGMVDAFDPSLANLSGISDASIYVSFVKQDTFVAVDEEGTEAAAVTTIGIELTSVPPQPRQFIIDKPFIFAIRERTTNTLLFIGKVVNPGAAD